MIVTKSSFRQNNIYQIKHKYKKTQKIRIERQIVVCLRFFEKKSQFFESKTSLGLLFSVFSFFWKFFRLFIIFTTLYFSLIKIFHITTSLSQSSISFIFSLTFFFNLGIVICQLFFLIPIPKPLSLKLNLLIYSFSFICLYSNSHLCISHT